MTLERKKEGLVLSLKDPSELSTNERKEALLYFIDETHGALMSIWGSMNQEGMRIKKDTISNLKELKLQIEDLTASVIEPRSNGRWSKAVYDERRKNFNRLLDVTVIPVLEMNNDNSHGDVPLHIKAMKTDCQTAKQKLDGLVKYVEKLEEIDARRGVVETMRDNQREKMSL